MSAIRSFARAYAAGFCKASYRCRFASDFRFGYLGLRLCATGAATPPPPPESSSRDVSLPADDDETEE